MRTFIRPSFVALLLAASAMVGCNRQSSPVASTPAGESSTMGEHVETDQAAITEALAQLSSEDRTLAESQKYCAIANGNPLGTMGTPLKIEVNGEPVFLCCAGCKTKALSNPEETLASVAKLKAENNVKK